jgi:hypothetical protein
VTNAAVNDSVEELVYHLNPLVTEYVLRLVEELEMDTNTYVRYLDNGYEWRSDGVTVEFTPEHRVLMTLKVQPRRSISRTWHFTKPSLTSEIVLDVTETVEDYAELNGG